jgi:hypothetical protein
VTKRKWERADHYELDPGAVVDVLELTRPSRWVPPIERARREAERAEERRALHERSEHHDLGLMMGRSLRRVLEKQARGEGLGFFDRVIPDRFDRR